MKVKNKDMAIWLGLLITMLFIVISIVLSILAGALNSPPYEQSEAVGSSSIGNPATAQQLQPTANPQGGMR